MSSFFGFIEKLFNVQLKSKNEVESDKNKSFQQIVIDNNYTLEEYTIETEDKYNLQIFHIKNNEKTNSNLFKSQIPVLFIHGLLDSSDGWICNGKACSFPFIMLNCKSIFDVWIMNCRGNKHSKLIEKASNLNKNTFWNFSFHEIGIYDIPQVITFIRGKNPNKLILFCHSTGATSVLAGLSDKIKFYQNNAMAFVFLSPLSRVNYTDSHFLVEQLENLSFFPCKEEVFPYHPDEESEEDLHFEENKNLYKNILFNSLSSNADRIDVYLSHYPSGTSRQMLEHFKQIFEKKEFSKYDYGYLMNQTLYSDYKAPTYNLDNIKNVKILIYTGKDDKISNVKDVQWLKDTLNKNNVIVDYQEFENIGHSSLLIPNNIMWFNYILRKLYIIIDESLRKN